MTTRRIISARKELKKDVVIILIGAFLAWVMSLSGALNFLLDYVEHVEVGAFIAGIFFTSAFTIVPASFAFVGIATADNLPTIAFFGALGAMVGDVIIFLFIRDRFAEDLMNSMRPSILHHILKSFHMGFLKWLSPILGSLIIASPLPDEFGLILLGLSRTKLMVLMPIAFIMNWAGIYLVVWLAHVI